MNIMNRFYLSILASCVICLGVPSAEATMIVTSIEAKAAPSNPGIKDYKITWQRVPGPRDDEQIPSGVYVFGAMEEHNHAVFACDWGGSSLFPGVQGTVCVNVNSSMTWKQAEESWLARYGAVGPGIVGHIGSADSRECVMFAGAATNGTAIGGQVNNGELVCVGAPPTPDPLCHVAGNTEFEFTAPPGNVDQVAEQQGQIICERDASVVLMSATGLSFVTFPWGRAELTVNGASLPAKLKTNPVANYTIRASVKGAGATAGVYKESLVLVVGYE